MLHPIFAILGPIFAILGSLVQWAKFLLSRIELESASASSNYASSLSQDVSFSLFHMRLQRLPSLRVGATGELTALQMVFQNQMRLSAAWALHDVRMCVFIESP